MTPRLFETSEGDIRAEHEAREARLYDEAHGYPRSQCVAMTTRERHRQWLYLRLHKRPIDAFPAAHGEDRAKCVNESIACYLRHIQRLLDRHDILDRQKVRVVAELLAEVSAAWGHGMDVEDVARSLWDELVELDPSVNGEKVTGAEEVA